MDRKHFSIGMIRNPTIEVSKKMEMEVIPHEDKTFHYQFTKGHDKLNCIFGKYKTFQFSSIKELGETIQKECLPNDVFVSGLAGYDSVSVLNPSQIQKLEISGDLPKEYITRTKNNFNWSNTPGVIAIDIDEQKDGKFVSKDVAIAYLEELFPGAPMLIKGSTSSHVYYSGKREVRDSEGKVIRAEGSEGAQELSGKKGLRIYIVISSLSFLYKAKEWLGVKLWNMDTGYLTFDSNGKDIFRCLIDLAMYSSTDRVDFIKASLTQDVPDFYQDFGEFTYVNENNPPFDVSRIKPVTLEEKSNANKKKQAEKNKIENKKLKEKIQKSKIESLAKNHPNVEKSKIEKSFHKLVNKRVLDELHSLFILVPSNSNLSNGNPSLEPMVEVITTNDIFKNEESASYYHGMPCASVLDPLYTPGKVYSGEVLTTNEILALSKDVDFTKAKILSLNDPPSIMDQAHGGTRFFFDTEFFDIANIERERKDHSPVVLPIWNFTEIANCFLNKNPRDQEIFGNVLRSLVQEESSIGIQYQELEELAYQVFKLTIDKPEMDCRNIWEKLSGYGLSLYEFMQGNEDLSLKNNLILKSVNKIDVSMRYKIVNNGFYKAKGNKLDSIIAEKRYDKDDGWTYKLGTPYSISDYQKEDVYYLENKGKTETAPVVGMWLNSKHKKRYSGGIEFLPIAGLVATKHSKMESSEKYIFNLYTGLNIVPKPSKKMHTEYYQDDKGYDKFFKETEDFDEDMPFSDYQSFGKDEDSQTEDLPDSLNLTGNIPEKVGIRRVKWKKQVSGCYLIDWHLKNVLCNGNTELYEYAMNWLANMFQHPYRAGETLLAFQGEEGIGKNQFWDMIDSAFGAFGTTITDPTALTGDFNSGVAEKILVVLNEAFWEGDKKGHSVLKGFITDKFVMSKKKHVDSISVRNTSHLVIMTNHEAVAPMSTGDRRIVNFDVSNKFARNREYFGKFIKEVKNGGTEAFVYTLLNRSLKGFNISKIPNSAHSESAINSIMNTAEPWLRWMYECLQDDEIKGLSVEMGMVIGKWDSKMENSWSSISKVNLGRIPAKVLFESYLRWKENYKGKRNDLTNNLFTRNLKRILVKSEKINNPTLDDKELVKLVFKKVRFDKYTSVNCLLFGDLETARTSFVTFLNKNIIWDVVETESLED